jgi:hypothetical protein
VYPGGAAYTIPGSWCYEVVIGSKQELEQALTTTCLEQLFSHLPIPPPAGKHVYKHVTGSTATPHVAQSCKEGRQTAAHWPPMHQQCSLTARRYLMASTRWPAHLMMLRLGFWKTGFTFFKKVWLLAGNLKNILPRLDCMHTYRAASLTCMQGSLAACTKADVQISNSNNYSSPLTALLGTTQHV